MFNKILCLLALKLIFKALTDSSYVGHSKELTWRIAMHFETQSVGIHEVLKGLLGLVGQSETICPSSVKGHSPKKSGNLFF